MTPRRDRRRDERGVATVIVAVACVALLAITGLAIDGGMEAAAYRHAQNAADAGALAAARSAFINATSTPPVTSTITGLTSVARTEVQHNNAQLASVNGSTNVSTSNPTIYAPATAGGMSAQSALTDMWAGVGIIPVNTNLDLVQTKSTATSALPAAGGSVASSQVDLGQVSVSGVTGQLNCYTAHATYTANTNTYGTSTACGLGTTPVGVSMGGTLLGGGATNTEVDSNNAPTSTPRVQGTSITGVVGLVSASASTAGSSTSLTWDPVSGVTAAGSVYAASLSAALTGVSVSSSSLDMHASISVDSTGTASISRTCAATTITINGTSVPIGTDCNPTVSLPSIAGVSLSAPYISPSWNTGTACSTNNGTGQITCSLTACMLRVQVSLAINQVLCLGEVVLSLAVVPINNTSYYPNFTGSVTVGATVPQPTYFLRILGWTQTNPASQATADLEAVIDEDQAAFTASPFGMPDTATAMTSPFNYERLQVGHTYYLYGSSMATYNPSPLMPSGWQGALSTSSNHRVGQAVTGRTGVTSGPTAYFSNGAYYLEPIYDPMDNVIEFYGVFLPVAGHANWGKFVNSVPASSGYIVQATSTSKWNPFLQGAVAIKLDN